MAQNTIAVSMATSQDVSHKDNISSTCYNFDNSATSVIGQLLMASVILTLNLMVVFVICKNRRRTFRKPAFIFIIALAAADMLLAVCLACFSAVAIADLQLPTTTWVNLTASTSICFNASVNFLFVIALDRLCFIVYNRSYTSYMRKRNVALLIALCWLVGLLPVLPLFFWNIGSCAEHCTCSSDQFLSCSHSSCSTVIKGFTKQFLFGLFFYFLIMLVSISMIYIILFVKVHRQANRVRNYSRESSTSGRSSRLRREFRLVRTLTVVVVTFFICWSPLMLLYVVDFVRSETFTISSIIAQTIMTPAVFNSMLNPIIYAARIPILKSYFCFRGCSSNKDTSTDRKRKSSAGSSTRKNFSQKTNKEHKHSKQNHIYKRCAENFNSASTSTPTAKETTKNNNKKETVKYSWPMSTIDRILMKRSSSLQRRKANYSYGLQANCSNNISHSKNQTCGQNTNVRTTVIEVPCLCDETK